RHAISSYIMPAVCGCNYYSMGCSGACAGGRRAGATSTGGHRLLASDHQDDRLCARMMEVARRYNRCGSRPYRTARATGHCGENAMFNRLSSYVFGGFLVFLLFIGQASSQQPGEVEIRQGVIEQITPMQLQSNHHRGVGAIVGGLGGLGIGSLIGGGTGRDVAMVAGALG